MYKSIIPKNISWLDRISSVSRANIFIIYLKFLEKILPKKSAKYSFICILCFMTISEIVYKFLKGSISKYSFTKNL